MPKKKSNTKSNKRTSNVNAPDPTNVTVTINVHANTSEVPTILTTQTSKCQYWREPTWQFQSFHRTCQGK